MKSFRSYLLEKGINNLYYITDISFIPKILRQGILCRNKIDHNFTYLKKAQILGEKNMNNLYNKDIRDYARLFFSSHTPMLRDILFSLHRYQTTAILQINPALMDRVEDCYFTDLSCTCRRFKLFKTVQDLEHLNWKYLTEDYDILHSKTTKNEKRLLKDVRGAEVLVYKKVAREFIGKEILVYSDKSRRDLLELLESNFIDISNLIITIDIDRNHFPAVQFSRAWKKKFST